jgi:hypothetical protein
MSHFPHEILAAAIAEHRAGEAQSLGQHWRMNCQEVTEAISSACTPVIAYGNGKCYHMYMYRELEEVVIFPGCL